MLRPDQETQQTTETEVNPLQLAVDLRKLFRQLDQFGDDELQLAEKLLGHIDQKLLAPSKLILSIYSKIDFRLKILPVGKSIISQNFAFKN